MMERFDSRNDVVFFFGAGASSPFGIPTMTQFVTNFESHLKSSAEKREQELYSDVKGTLESKLGRPPDLEAIFSVIDGIINYLDAENLSMFTLYFATQYRENFPSKEQVETAKNLKQKFQAYVKKNCSDSRIIIQTNRKGIPRLF